MASTENLEEIDLEDYINEILKKKLEKMNYTFDDLMNKVKKMNLLEKKEKIIPTKENAEFYKGPPSMLRIAHCVRKLTCERSELAVRQLGEVKII
jgi:hypothetical protein